MKYCQTIDYELSIILECIVYQFHHLLVMKWVDLHSQKIEHMGCVGHVTVCSQTIMRVSLKGLMFWVDEKII